MANLPDNTVYLVLTAERLVIVDRPGTTTLDTRHIEADAASLARLHRRPAVLIVELAEIEATSEILPALDATALTAYARRKLEKRFPATAYFSGIEVSKSSAGERIAHMYGIESAPLKPLLSWLERGEVYVVGLCAVPQLLDKLAPQLARNAGFEPRDAGLVALWEPGGIRIVAMRDGRIGATRFIPSQDAIDPVPESLDALIGVELEETWSIIRRAKDGAGYPWCVLALPERWRHRFGARAQTGGFEPRILTYREAADGLHIPGRQTIDSVWQLLAACAHTLPAYDMLPGGRRLRATGHVLSAIRAVGAAAVALASIFVVIAGLFAWNERERLEAARVARAGAPAVVPGQNADVADVAHGDAAPTGSPAAWRTLADERERRLAAVPDLDDLLERLGSLRALAEGLATRGLALAPEAKPEDGFRLAWRLETAAPPALDELGALANRVEALRKRVAGLAGLEDVRWSVNPLAERHIQSSLFDGKRNLQFELLARLPLPPAARPSKPVAPSGTTASAPPAAGSPQPAPPGTPSAGEKP